MEPSALDNDLRIDPEALDTEWLNQAHLTYKYGEEQARAKAVMERAKERLEVVAAQAQSEIRRKPEKFGLSSPTESLVKATVVQHDKYKEANAAYLDARETCDLVIAALAAIEAKRRALENLVRLLQMNYFAGPSEPRPIKRLGESSPAPMTQTAVRSTIRRRLNRE